MTKDQIEQMLGEMGIPFRYHHFTQKEMQDIPLPIVVWLTPGTDNFFADGKTYKKITKKEQCGPVAGKSSGRSGKGNQGA